MIYAQTVRRRPAEVYRDRYPAINPGRVLWSAGWTRHRERPQFKGVPPEQHVIVRNVASEMV